MEKLCRSARYLILGIAALSVAACAGGSADLLEYIDEVKARPGGRIEPLPQIKPYDTFAYQASDLRSPFMPDQPNAPGNITGPQPLENRNKEYLEQFPLDTLNMVGTLDKSGKIFGLVQTQDGLVHRVIAGNYLGQNDGRIVAISDAEISLEELVPDGIGGFFKRSAAIGLTD
jgi:type IV pilus assembly protein PilP